MSLMLLGILNSQAAGGGFNPEAFSKTTPGSIASDSSMAELNGTVIIWVGNNQYIRQTGGPGSSWTALTVGNNAGAVAANANVFVAVPRGASSNSIRISTTAASGSWTDVPNTSYSYGERSVVIADKADANRFYITGRIGEMEYQFPRYSLDNGVTSADFLSYGSTRNQYSDSARSSSQWMIVPSLTQFNQNDFAYFTTNGTSGTSWTQRTASLNWNDAGNSVTSDGTYFYGSRGNSRQTWKRTGTNTFTTATDPSNTAGPSILHYGFEKFFFFKNAENRYWYSDTWDSGWTQVSIGGLTMQVETRFNYPVNSETNSKVYTAVSSSGGGLMEIG